MTDQEKVSTLNRYPQFLELVPRYGVQGGWMHTIRQTELSKLENAARNIAGSSKEICVTDANEKPFWEFSEYRRFALVFEGECAVLWNADVHVGNGLALQGASGKGGK